MAEEEVSELLACPFCGSAPCAAVQNSNRALSGGGWWQEVWCENCDTTGPLRKTEIEAIDAWNRRTPTPVTEDVVLLNDLFDFLGGVDGAAELRSRIIAALASIESKP